MLSNRPSTEYRPSPRQEGFLNNKPKAEIAKLAKARLQGDPHFRGRMGAIHVKEQDGTLVLDGRVPSFYLKQMLQTVLKDIEGVNSIENRVEVFLPTKN